MAKTSRETGFTYIALNSISSMFSDLLISRDWQHKSDQLLAMSTNQQDLDRYHNLHSVFKVDLLWLSQTDLYLNDRSIMDKFLLTNRFKNLGVVTDMNCIRHVFLKVQDMFTSLDHFILETYVLPSCYQEMSRRIIKERISLDDSAVTSFKRKNSKDKGAKRHPRESQHIWVLNKQAEGKDGRKTFVVDPDDQEEMAKMYDYMPCVAQRQLKNPFLYDQCRCVISVHVLVEEVQPLKVKIFQEPFVRFVGHGNWAIGFKTGHRFSFDRLLEILKMRGLNQPPVSPTKTGLLEVNEQHDPLWNSICQKIIITLLMMQHQIQYLPDRTIQLLEFKFYLDDQGQPWLSHLKGDFNFKVKDNLFDEAKAHLSNEFIKSLESKVLQYRRLLKKNPMILVQEDPLPRKARVTVQQLENSHIYKRQQFKFKDALTLAKLENVPQAFYLYKQRNDILLSKLKAKEKPVQIDKSQDKPVLTEAQREKIRKNIIKTKNLMQFHVSKNFQEQMLEDIEKILNCENSVKMTQAIYLVRKIDPELIKDGFRVLYANYHFEDFQHMVRGYKSLLKLSQEEQTWLQKFFFAILQGNKNPKIFLTELRDLLKIKESNDESNKEQQPILEQLSSAKRATEVLQLEDLAQVKLNLLPRLSRNSVNITSQKTQSTSRLTSVFESFFKDRTMTQRNLSINEDEELLQMIESSSDEDWNDDQEMQELPSIFSKSKSTIQQSSLQYSDRLKSHVKRLNSLENILKSPIVEKKPKDNHQLKVSRPNADVNQINKRYQQMMQTIKSYKKKKAKSMEKKQPILQIVTRQNFNQSAFDHQLNPKLEKTMMVTPKFQNEISLNEDLEQLSPKSKKQSFKFKLLFPFNELTKKEIQDEMAALNEGDYFTLAMIIKKVCASFKCHNFKR